MVRATAAWVQSLLHRLFTATLAVKGTLACVEASIGFWLWLRAHLKGAPELKPVEGSLEWLNKHEITLDPQDPMVQWTGEQAQHLALVTDQFYAVYLMVHALLKLGMVILLARRVIWAYPAAIGVLAAFVIYQLHGFSQSHSPSLLLLSGFDLFMIWLVWREYRMMKPVASRA